MNIIESYMTPNKDESTPTGWKKQKLSHNQEKQKANYAFAFLYIQRDFLILAVCIM